MAEAEVRSPTKSSGSAVDCDTAMFGVEEGDEDEDEDEGFNQNIESLVGQLRCAPARPRTRARARRAIARTWAPAGPHGSLRHVGGRCRRVNNLRWYNGGVLARQHP
jgi:hypothetical protein